MCYYLCNSFQMYDIKGKNGRFVDRRLSMKNLKHRHTIHTSAIEIGLVPINNTYLKIFIS